MQRDVYAESNVVCIVYADKFCAARDHEAWRAANATFMPRRRRGVTSGEAAIDTYRVKGKRTEVVATMRGIEVV